MLSSGRKTHRDRPRKPRGNPTRTVLLPLLAISLVTVPSLLWYQAGHRNAVSRGGDIGAITPPSQRLVTTPPAQPGGWDDGYNEQGNCSRAYRAGAVPKTPPARRLALVRPTVKPCK